jgi:glycerol-3-phosphate dehydrogenase subunit C
MDLELELVRESLDHCVKCTICETFCPVSAATPLFPGPKYVGPQAERFRGAGPSPDASLDYCSGCGICTQVCPQGVRIAEINARARAALKARDGAPLCRVAGAWRPSRDKVRVGGGPGPREPGGPSTSVRVRDRLIARPGLLGRLGVVVAPVANRLMASPAVRAVTERALHIDRQAPMPMWARRPLRRKGRGVPAVAYFSGCNAAWFEPFVADAALAVLAHHGLGAAVPRSRCCGLPLQSNGLFDDARRHVRRAARLLAPHARAGRPVVATSTSCGLMLKREAREILGVEDDDLRVVSEHTVDICEYLRDLWDEGRLRTDMRPVPLTVAYYAPCQQRGHGMGAPALDLLALVPELRVVPVEGSCCGIAGTYGLKQEKHDIAMAVGAALFRDLRAAQPDVVACDSETCRWQITAATGLPTVHPVELLARAYGLPTTRT